MTEFEHDEIVITSGNRFASIHETWIKVNQRLDKLERNQTAFLDQLELSMQFFNLHEAVDEIKKQDAPKERTTNEHQKQT